MARTPEFRELAHDLAMQVAATSPGYVSIDDVPAGAWTDLEKEHGDREKAAAAVVLLEQPFIKDPKLTIRDLVRERIGKLGENIVVRRFARFEVGAGNERGAGRVDERRSAGVVVLTSSRPGLTWEGSWRTNGSIESS